MKNRFTVKMGGGGKISDGFTLVELLVVIAIIGVLIALLLPAVQAAREAGRRTQCGNKVKQIALAVHNFHDINSRFPCMAADPMFSNKRYNRTGWMLLLLPYIEQNQVYGAAMAITAAADGSTTLYNQGVVNVKIDTFLCPSDSNLSLWQTGDPCHTNYRGCRADLATSSAGINNSNNFGLPRSWLTNGPKWSDDSICVGGDLKGLEAVTDGTSNSIMLSEGGIYDRDTLTTGGDYRTRMVASSSGHHGHQPQNCLNQKQNLLNGTATVYYYSDWKHNVGMRAFDWYSFHNAFYTLLPPNSPSCTNSGNGAWANDAMMTANSYHPGGVQIAFLDASGRFINDAIKTQNLNLTSEFHDAVPKTPVADGGETFSYGVWSELGSINGGETPDLQF